MKLAWSLLAALGCGGDPPGGAAVDTGCASTETWASAPPLVLGATQETAAVAVAGKIYVLGGFSGSTQVVAAVQVLDTAACSWALGPELPRAVHHANAAAVDGTIFVVGSMEGGDFNAIGDVWAWNPATETSWTARASVPVGLERGSAVVGAIAGKLYVAGGLRTRAVTDVSIYDPAADTWTAGPALPSPRDHACGGVIGDKLYVIGGRQGAIGSIASTVFEYTPGGAWIERAPMLTRRGGTACGVIDQRLIVVGGEGNPAAPSGVFEQVEAYDAIADTWEALAPMPTPRHGMGAAAWNGKLFVPGGAIVQGFGTVATHEVLTP